LEQKSGIILTLTDYALNVFLRNAMNVNPVIRIVL
jgi:hypothetical protein